jgi:SdrD B-like protein
VEDVMSFAIQGNAGVAGALVTLSGAASATVTADTVGNFQFGGLAAGSYTMTPALAGYSFAPASQSKTIAGSNVLNVDFVATLTSDSSAISTIDSRISPNSSLNQNGTQVNVVGTLSALPPVDSRASVPVDSRVLKPVNSRI